jgi:hypothetical protein
MKQVIDFVDCWRRMILDEAHLEQERSGNTGQSWK